MARQQGIQMHQQLPAYTYKINIAGICTIITGSAVALHCCNASITTEIKINVLAKTFYLSCDTGLRPIQKSIRKWKIRPPVKS